jgi:hypothetical protein
MGIFQRLFTPAIPNISDIDGVVEWFLAHDEKIKDVKENVPEPHLSNLKQTIVENLMQNQTAAELQQDINDAAVMSQSSLETLHQFKMLNEKGPPNGKDADEIVNAAAQAFVIEASSAAMLRIYGYFMTKKFNIQPM